MSKFVPFVGNELWADVTPLPQDEGEHRVVQIAVDATFTQTMDYFRAILKLDERSERALWLTQRVIDLNSANYTAWNFRRTCLFSLKKDLEEELDFVAKIAKDSPKNYQLWHHRKALLEHINKPCDEFVVTAMVLQLDEKNYHVWGHRQWLLRKFGSWDQELLFVDSLLKKDIRNNSAWNQRHFVIEQTTGFGGKVVETELAYTRQKLLLAPSNESAWNYLEALAGKQECAMHKEFVNVALELIEKKPACRHAFSFLLELSTTYAKGVYDEETSSEKAAKLCDYLCNIDQVRAKYWRYRKLQACPKLRAPKVVNSQTESKKAEDST